MSRPELTGHAAQFYNAKEARKYDSSSRMMGVQRDITERAIELLRLSDDNPAYVLDIGCGSGLSGRVLEKHGHAWVGCDISRDMLGVAKERMLEDAEEGKASRATAAGNDAVMKDNNENDDDENDDDDNEYEIEDTKLSTGDLLHHDMGTGLPFRPATFDACLSISALQWLCYSNSRDQIPRKRLTRFFSSLYTVLKRGGRAVLQFYPETPEQAVLITEAATRVGFAGGVVVDYPNSAKAKKHYLVLTFDRSSAQKRQQAVKEAKERAVAEQGKTKKKSSVTVSSVTVPNGKQPPVRKKKGVKTKEWILHKKQTQRTKGKDVRPDTKYTARRRPTKF